MQATFLYSIMCLNNIRLRVGYLVELRTVYIFQLPGAPVSEGLWSDGMSAGHLCPKRVIFQTLDCGVGAEKIQVKSHWLSHFKGREICLPWRDKWGITTKNKVNNSNKLQQLIDGSTYSPSRPPCPRSGGCCRWDRNVSPGWDCRRCFLCIRWRCWKWQWGSDAGSIKCAPSSISWFSFSVCSTERSPWRRSHSWTETVNSVSGWTASLPARLLLLRSRGVYLARAVSEKQSKEGLVSLWHSSQTKTVCLFAMRIQLKVRKPEGSDFKLVDLCNSYEELQMMTVADMKETISKQLGLGSYVVLLMFYCLLVSVVLPCCCSS